MEQPEQSNAEAQVDNRVDSTFMYENPSSDTVQPAPTITQAPLEQNNEQSQTEQASPVAEAQDNVSAKDDPDRIAYWQSQTDKAKNDAYLIAQETQKYKQLYEQQLQKTSVSNEPQNRLRSSSVEEPVRPEKPISYNEVDAYNDPESNSFKYRIENDKYRDARLDYVERLEGARMQQQKVDMQKAQERQLINQTYVQAQNTYGYDQKKAADFVTWAVNPNNITVDSLHKLFEIQNAPSNQQRQVEQKKQAMQNQNEALKIPTTTTVAPGVSQPQMNDQDLFNQALLSKSYKRRK